MEPVIEVHYHDFGEADGFVITEGVEEESTITACLHIKYKDADVGKKLDLLIPLLEACYSLPVSQRKQEKSFSLENNYIYDASGPNRDFYGPLVKFNKPVGFCLS